MQDIARQIAWYRVQGMLNAFGAADVIDSRFVSALPEE